MPFLQWVAGEPECALLGPAEYGRHGLVSRHLGDARLVLSVPHGGEMRPPFVEDRRRPVSGRAGQLQGDPDEDTNNRVTTAADIYTQQMALVTAREFAQLTGRRPHLVMCNLHRSKLDTNRPLRTATEDPVAEKVYAEYHAFLTAAREEVGTGLLVDLHGQNHQQNSTGAAPPPAATPAQSSATCTRGPSSTAGTSRGRRPAWPPSWRGALGCHPAYL
jgi:hypothetical protein